MAGKKESVLTMCKKVVNKVDLEEPTPTIDQEHVGCTQQK